MIEQQQRDADAGVLEPPGGPRIRVRARSFMALIVAPTPPIARWMAAMDQHMQAAPGFFTDRPIICDLSQVDDLAEASAALDGLAARDLRLIGVEGAGELKLDDTRWRNLPTIMQGRSASEPTSKAAEARASLQPPPPSGSMVVEGPVRSGQSIYFEDGDITIVGSVASGAEVVAGGSIHIYGALRGRAIAGLKAGVQGRVFCRKMEAELVGVDRLFRTAEHWGKGLHGRPVVVRCDRGALRISPLD